MNDVDSTPPTTPPDGLEQPNETEDINQAAQEPEPAPVETARKTDHSTPNADSTQEADPTPAQGFWAHMAGALLHNKLVISLITVALIVTGLLVAPFRFDMGGLPRSPVPVDAIPDIGENQQIVFTRWAGRSPKDVEDQVSQPLTSALLGVPGVRTIRSYSMFGFSTVYVIFEEGVDFYWSRSRILEKLASLPAGTLPSDAAPALGPDATALGQVFWYSLQGRDPKTNKTVGGWDSYELRSIQDWDLRFALQGVKGVSEVASVGGHAREYQVRVDPDAMQAHDVSIEQIAKAVGDANLDVGARTMEVNRVEYIIRGVGQISSLKDLREVVVANREHTPVHVEDVAQVTLGPQPRRGVLDIDGAEAVGGVVVARFGANPLAVIERVKAKLHEIEPGLPKRVLPDGTVSKIKVVPFYDRSTLIHETLNTLSTALIQQMLITLLVVIVMLRNLRSSFMITGLLPLGVLAAFVAMKFTGVDANIMALGGIAIAIGTMVDMGIVLTENIVESLEKAPPGTSRFQTVRDATAEVAPAVMTSTMTTLVGFIPVFALTDSAGKLFTPLAYTKSFAMLAALIISIVLLPVIGSVILRSYKFERLSRWTSSPLGKKLNIGNLVDVVLAIAGVVIAVLYNFWGGIAITALALWHLGSAFAPKRWQKLLKMAPVAVSAVIVTVLLSDSWLPLGIGRGLWLNRLFTFVVVTGLVGVFLGFVRVYPPILRWALQRKALALSVPTALVAFGLTAWLGFGTIFAWAPQPVRTSAPFTKLAHAFPGFGREFMPPFDEGSFLFMPTTMPHASLGEAIEQLHAMDKAIAAVPEVVNAAGKLGRADTSLDPAPISMYEVIVNYKPEYKLDEHGKRGVYRYDTATDTYPRDKQGHLIPDNDGRPFRQWRPNIHTPDDIWKEVQQAAKMPALTNAPKLMPIAARIVMLQSGMRASMGLKVRGPTLRAVEKGALELEQALKQAPGVVPSTVVADRVVGKPYIELVIDREAIATHGLSIRSVQRTIQLAIGGKAVTQTIEGRERYPVRIRYVREKRDTVEALGKVLVQSPLGHPVPLRQLVHVRYVRGPQVIKSEDSFLVSYVTFGKVANKSEVDVVNEVRSFLKHKQKTGELALPSGVSYKFAGSYENQVKSEKRLTLLIPTAALLIFLLIYFQFRRVSTTLMVFSGVLVSMSGGFVLIWLYGQPWFLGTIFGIDLRGMMRVGTINMSVAVWVGFIALLGIATDDGVVMATYLSQRFAKQPIDSIKQIRRLTLESATRRVRPCMMTTSTTVLALLPVITSRGRGADVMAPMALPSLGGMSFELITLFVVPLLYASAAEWRLKRTQRSQEPPTSPIKREKSVATEPAPVTS